MTKFSCKYCVPPKRHSNCHATCKDYLEEKAEHEKERETKRKAKQDEQIKITIRRRH